ncbi:MAG TPA: hypothetical protein VFX92_01140 [Candidatus Krumholzibacteria bacterium]|nr:hypothetical protein [Candidatus Krumholzibacteria bacterium]
MKSPHAGQEENDMRKIIMGIVLVVAFAVGLSFGLGTPTAQAGKTRCWTTCSGGEALECCRIDGKLLCRVLVGGC